MGVCGPPVFYFIFISFLTQLVWFVVLARCGFMWWEGVYIFSDLGGSLGVWFEKYFCSGVDMVFWSLDVRQWHTLF